MCWALVSKKFGQNLQSGLIADSLSKLHVLRVAGEGCEGSSFTEWFGLLPLRHSQIGNNQLSRHP